MQTSNKSTVILAKKIGEIVKSLRKKLTNKSVNKLGNEYGLSNHTISRLEKGVFNCKFVTLWTVAEALGIKPSELVKMIEESMPENFSIVEE